MRPRRLAPVLLALVLLAACPAVAPAAVFPGPWATVNLCDPPDRPGAVGVRVAAPAGPGAQWMRIQTEWYDGPANRWRLVRSGGDGGWVRLGGGKTRVRGGITFAFQPPAAGLVLVVRGRVSLEWRRGGKVVRRATLRTSGGHAADAGGASIAQCFVIR